MENNSPTELMPIPTPEVHPIKEYFTTLYALHTRPTVFFQNLLTSPRSMAFALTFAVVTHWIGSALGYLWQAALGRAVMDRMSGGMQIFDQMSAMAPPHQVESLMAYREKAFHWLWGTGSVLIDPFKTLITILVISFFIWIASRLFAEKNQRYDTAVTLVSLGMAPSILQGVPLVGTFVSSIFIFVVTLIGARELYRVQSGRALLIVLFPQILFLLLVLAALGVLFYFFLSLFTSVISF
jgi:hypothetical protein